MGDSIKIHPYHRLLFGFRRARGNFFNWKGCKGNSEGMWEGGGAGVRSGIFTRDLFYWLNHANSARNDDMMMTTEAGYKNKTNRALYIKLAEALMLQNILFFYLENSLLHNFVQSMQNMFF